MTLPPDPIYDADIGNANRTRDTTLAGLGQQRTQAALQFGYTPTYDASGFVKSLALDPNNPYSKAALLKQSYDQSLRRNTQNFANRGQLYAGSYGVAQSLADQGYGQNTNSLQNAFINFIARNQGGINAANTNWLNAQASAGGNATARAVANDTGDAGDNASSPNQAALQAQIKQTYAKPKPIPRPVFGRTQRTPIRRPGKWGK